MNQIDGQFVARQIVGGRPYQEDDYGFDGPLFLLADGMGGQVRGDMASSTAIKTFMAAYPETTGPIAERLHTCLNAANDALAAAIEEQPELDGMGTTLVGIVFSQDGIDWISVGDSPLWLFRDGQLRRLNADHSMAAVFAEMVAAGTMTEEEAATDPNRHALRSAVMGEEISMIDVASQPVPLRKNDLVILASDGLMTLEDAEIAHIVESLQNESLERIADALIQAIEDVGNPHQDNTTILLYAPRAKSLGNVRRRNKWLVGAALGVALLGLLSYGATNEEWRNFVLNKEEEPMKPLFDAALEEGDWDRAKEIIEQYASKLPEHVDEWQRRLAEAQQPRETPGGPAATSSTPTTGRSASEAATSSTSTTGRSASEAAKAQQVLEPRVEESEDEELEKERARQERQAEELLEKQRREKILQDRFDVALRKENFAEAEKYLDTLHNNYWLPRPELKELERSLHEAREREKGKTFSLSEGANMDFVWIKPGGAIGEGFWLGKHEVTQGQWSSVMKTTPWKGQANVESNSSHPAVYISWDDVQKFIRKLNDAPDGSRYRLPSAAEWEYACRAGTSTEWSFGDDAGQLGEYAWYKENAKDVGEEYAHAVGTKSPNLWDLYDMHGNVAEWVQGKFLRGGSFKDSAEQTTSERSSNKMKGSQQVHIGVRLLREWE